MTNKKRTCVFCGGLPLSKEHVAGQWTRNLPRPSARILREGKLKPGIPLNYAYFNENDEYVQGTEVRRPMVPPLQEVVVKAVCKRCNNTWMSALENRMRILFQKPDSMKHPRTIWKNRELIAQWAHKTFLMYDLWNQPDQRMYSAAEYSRFFRERRPSPTTRIYTSYSSSKCADYSIWIDGGTLFASNENTKSVIRNGDNWGCGYLAVEGLTIIEHWFRDTFPNEMRAAREMSQIAHKTAIELGWQCISSDLSKRRHRKRDIDAECIETARLAMRTYANRLNIYAKQLPPT